MHAYHQEELLDHKTCQPTVQAVTRGPQIKARWLSERDAVAHPASSMGLGYVTSKVPYNSDSMKKVVRPLFECIQ